MKRSALCVALAALAALMVAAPAQAAFGLHGFDVRFSGPTGEAQMQAGSHPFDFETSFEVNVNPKEELPEAPVKDLRISQVPGFAGIPAAVQPCKTVDFLVAPDTSTNVAPKCADSSAVGLTEVTFGQITNEGPSTETQSAPVYNLEPPPGSAAKLGFYILSVPITIDVGVSEKPPYNVVATVSGVSQVLEFFGSKFTIWGVPGNPEHDPLRGHCLASSGASLGSCSGGPETPFLISPRACEGPLESGWEADSWVDPGAWASGSALTHGESPAPSGFGGCPALSFSPTFTAAPSTDRAAAPSGLDATLSFADEGIKNPHGTAASDIKRAEVTLPEGVTLNPSVAEGLVGCSEADLARERSYSQAGEGCPEASKVGSVEVTTPLLQETLQGSLYVAQPYENPTHSLIALYMVIRNRQLGVLVTQAAEVRPDPRTGQIVTVFDEIPQFPLGEVSVHLRSGGRSPLISPSLCGAYVTEARLTPWADPAASVPQSSEFEISSGPGGGPCPTAGSPPFDPGFAAGTLDNSAGRYSPFFMRLTRPDGDQDLTRFSATLPPGLVARLAGTAECPEADIALARSRSGRGGGREELASPSCPASSQIGSLKAGAGVGSELTYVPGRLYLAGPYNGAPLSVVAITPAVAGPFDVGDVVVRQALAIDPRSARVRAVGDASDQIPHILDGIPLSVRDIQISVDKPNFTLNPTDCSGLAVGAEIWGGGANPFSTADDAPVSLVAPFRAAGCAALGFKPSISLKLKGGTRRGAFPKLRGAYVPRPGDANLSQLVLRLPHSAFLEQGHFGTICTRVQYAASACPAKSVYGHARAFTPLLAQPLEGPVYLRSSSHNLPDLVADLHGIVDVEAVARIDSKHGGIRATFSEVPDAPLEKVVVNMKGGKKGLIVNSTNLCAAKHRADVSYTAHNSKSASGRPLVRAQCPKGHKRHR